MHKKISGFGSLVLLMAVVIVVLLGAVGWLTWDRAQHATDSNSSKVSSSSSSSSIDGNAAAGLVAEFYGKYAILGSDREGLIKQYGTASLLNDWNVAMSDPHGVGGDPILCAQSIPESVTVTGHKINGPKVDVSVEEAQSAADILTVSVVNQNGLKIDHVACPQQ